MPWDAAGNARLLDGGVIGLLATGMKLHYPLTDALK
jgi:hypothetical protein